MLVKVNRNEVERLYTTFLLEKVHNDNTFNKFLIENFDKVCPAVGIITYEGENLKCSIYGNDSEDNETYELADDEAPWL